MSSLYLSQALKSETNNLLTLIRGVPGTGKSTFAKSMASFHGGPVHLEADMWHSRDGEYRWSPDNVQRAHRWCRETAEVLLQTRGLVVVSNTFTRYAEMFDYIEYCYRHKFACNVITLTSEYGNIHGVPEETMIKMRDRFESHQTIMEKIRADFPQ